MSTFLTDIAKVLKSDQKTGDKSFYGVVKEKITDGSTVTGYKVSIGGDEDIIEARKMAGAEVGDTVLCTLLSNGSVVVSGRKDGDKDAQDAQETADNTAQDLATNYSTTEETIELIGEYGGGDYQVVEYAKSSSQTVKPTTGWSEKLPNLSQSEQFLWMRYVIVDGDTRTVVPNSESVATLMQGVYVYANNRANTAETNAKNYADTTVIDGGRITTGTISANRIDVSNILKIGPSNDAHIQIEDGSLKIVGYDSEYVRISSGDGISGIYVNDFYGMSISSYGSMSFNCSLQINGSEFCYAGSNRPVVHGNIKTDVTTAGSVAAGIDGDGYLRPKVSSSKRYKKHIKKVNADLKDRVKKLYDLDVKSWIYKKGYLCETDDFVDRRVFGVIAEDIAPILPEAMHYKDGKIENYNDRLFANALLLLIQDQHKEIEELKQRVEALENK